ncbi:MAG: FAD-dependent oxidoreductase, partial [Tateyamaria sp.]
MTFPIHNRSPVTWLGPPPNRADVVVIGGGVIGVCTALYLAEAGKRVVLLEKGRIAGEQSSRNWGWIRQQGRDPDELPIMVDANRLWRDLA